MGVTRLCFFCFFFGLCKITVVQVSSSQCDADRQARKEDSQALVFATKIFLVLQLAVLPGMWLWLQKKPALSARAAFISRQGGRVDTEGRRKVLSKTGRQKWLPLSKGRGCTRLTDPPVLAAR